jgi:hypothetical protein
MFDGNGWEWVKALACGYSATFMVCPAREPEPHVPEPVTMLTWCRIVDPAPAWFVSFHPHGSW